MEAVVTPAAMLMMVCSGRTRVAIEASRFGKACGSAASTTKSAKSMTSGESEADLTPRSSTSSATFFSSRSETITFWPEVRPRARIPRTSAPPMLPTPMTPTRNSPSCSMGSSASASYFTLTRPHDNNGTAQIPNAGRRVGQKHGHGASRLPTRRAGRANQGE